VQEGGAGIREDAAGLELMLHIWNQMISMLHICTLIIEGWSWSISKVISF